MWKTFAPFLGLAFGLTTAPFAPLAAQTDDSARVTAEQALEKEREVYGAPAPKPAQGADCDAADENSDSHEIVVCARKPGDNSRYRVKSTAELDPKSHRNLYDGLPRGPDVSSLPDCSSGCIRLGKAPPPIHLIDLSKIPEPPPGSDADKISKGEMAAP